MMNKAVVFRRIMLVIALTFAFTAVLVLHADIKRFNNILEGPNSDFSYSSSWIQSPAFNLMLLREPSTDRWVRASPDGSETLVRRTDFKGMRFWTVVSQRPAGEKSFKRGSD